LLPASAVAILRIVRRRRFCVAVGRWNLSQQSERMTTAQRAARETRTARVRPQSRARDAIWLGIARHATSPRFHFSLPFVYGCCCEPPVVVVVAFFICRRGKRRGKDCNAAPGGSYVLPQRSKILCCGASGRSRCFW
jgi:hypothetical protein